MQKCTGPTLFDRAIIVVFAVRWNTGCDRVATDTCGQADTILTVTIIATLRVSADIMLWWRNASTMTYRQGNTDTIILIRA